MALRSSRIDDEEDSNKKPGISGLPVFWQNANKLPEVDYERWQMFFEMSLMGKYSIEVQEITRPDDPDNARNEKMMGSMDKASATKKAISLLFMSIGSAGRKTLLDKYPGEDLRTKELRDVLDMCKETFEKPRNRCLDRTTFFQRKQQPNETLVQFWNSLNGLAAKGDFGGYANTLVMDIFIANMTNIEVQTRLTTEPKTTPNEVLEFAKAYEQGLIRQKTYESPTAIKDEPVYNVDRRQNNYTRQGQKTGNPKCYRCGADFTPAHQKECRAKNEICSKCKRKGHYARCCRGGNNSRSGGLQTKGSSQTKRINAVNNEENSSGESTDNNESVLMVDSGPQLIAPFMIERQ